MASLPKKRKNGQLKGIFREIFISTKNELAPFGLVFVYPPENFEQQKLGTLFGIIKIADISRDSSYVSNLLASVIKKEYFSKPDRSAEDSFETSLRKANLALAELARQGSVKWTGNINFAGGVLEKNNLHFSKLGSTDIYLLRGGAIADIGKGLGADNDGTEIHPLKTFSDISSGKLEKGDCLVFATSDLAEIFSQEELRQNAARFSREEFPDIISASLAANSELSGAIVINLTDENAPTPLAMPPQTDYVSTPIEQMSPSGILPDRSERIEPKEPYAAADILPPPREDKQNQIYISEGEEVIPKKSLKEKLLPPLKRTASELCKNGAKITKKSVTLLKSVDWPQRASSAKNFFGKINFKKINPKIWIGIGVLIAIVAVSLIFTAFKKKTAAVPEAPAASQEQASSPASPLNDVQAKNIENISQVAPLPQDSHSLLLLDGALFSISGDKSISRIDPASGQIQTSDSSISSGSFVLAAAMPDLNSIFVLTSDKKIITFTPVNKNFQENTIALPDNLNATDIKSYLTYLYVLDPAANQIYRYPRAEGGFGERQDWLKSGTDIKGADKFAINEDIYAANNLNIVPLFQGKSDSSVDFQKPQVPLRIDGVYTDTGFASIYVLDNANHRVVQCSKDGKIAAQYFNDQISGIKNFTVDEKNKIVYLQSADSILKFSME